MARDRGPGLLCRAGDRAAVARGPAPWGQGLQGQAIDVRARIECRDGSRCHYFSQGDCRYKHTDQPNQNQVNLPNQKQTTQNQHFPSQIIKNQTSESAFNMQEMKLTIDNLVKAVYNLKSLSDFPKVDQKNQQQ